MKIKPLALAVLSIAVVAGSASFIAPAAQAGVNVNLAIGVPPPEPRYEHRDLYGFRVIGVGMVTAMCGMRVIGSQVVEVMPIVQLTGIMKEIIGDSAKAIGRSRRRRSGEKNIMSIATTMKVMATTISVSV